jgi:hypothetical protein
MTSSRPPRPRKVQTGGTVNALSPLGTTSLSMLWHAATTNPTPLLTSLAGSGPKCPSSDAWRRRPRPRRKVGLTERRVRLVQWCNPYITTAKAPATSFQRGGTKFIAARQFSTPKGAFELFDRTRRRRKLIGTMTVATGLALASAGIGAGVANAAPPPPPPCGGPAHPCPPPG